METDHHDRPLTERESRRWLETAVQAKAVLSSADMITVVDDREGDIYAEWASLPGPCFHILTRAMVNRPLVGRTGKLFTAARRFHLAGKRTIELPARSPARAKRTAVVALRYGEVNICRPQGEQDRSLPASVRLRLIEVRETWRRRKGIEPLHWRLLTTHEMMPIRPGRLSAGIRPDG